MNKPHKHCEVIKAWADGAEIQVKVSGTWSTIVSYPIWYEDLEYRIKPPTIRYRVALINKSGNGIETTTVDTPHEEQCVQGWAEFVDWLTDWVEVEV